MLSVQNMPEIPVDECDELLTLVRTELSSAELAHREGDFQGICK